MKRARILIVDDEESIRYTFENFLTQEGHEVATAATVTEGLKKIAGKEIDLVFTDIILEGRSGIELLQELRLQKRSCPVIMITGVPNLDTATEAVRLGAFDYIAKPVLQEQLLKATREALRFKKLIDEKERYRTNIEAIFSSIRDAIVTVDRDLKILAINPTAEEILDLHKEDVGQPFPERPGEGYRQCRAILRETLNRSEPRELDRRPLSWTGKKKTATLTTSPLKDQKGHFTGAVLVLRDETRLEELEKRLEDRQRFHRMIGRNHQMQKIYSLIDHLADYTTTVLITGESGTGKELVAEAIHFQGARREKPLVKVNCSALSENLLESELFGHIKGAFTDAVEDKIGRFQRADGGTILLDEIGDLSERMQLRLLRVLQEMEFERVGESTPIHVDVRVIAATHRDLPEKVRTGAFREDLYYRLRVVEIHLPPLRERLDDLPLLVDHFLRKLNSKFRKSIRGVTDPVMELFMNYRWPGNIRELEHTLEHGAILCLSDLLTREHLPPYFRELSESSVKLSPRETPRRIRKALEKTGGNKARAARILGISRRTLYRKIDEYGIETPDDIG